MNEKNVCMGDHSITKLIPNMVTFRQSVPLQYNHLFIMDSSFVDVNQTYYNPTSTIQTTLNYADIGI